MGLVIDEVFETGEGVVKLKIRYLWIFYRRAPNDKLILVGKVVLLDNYGYLHVAGLCSVFQALFMPQKLFLSYLSNLEPYFEQFKYFRTQYWKLSLQLIGQNWFFRFLGHLKTRSRIDSSLFVQNPVNPTHTKKFPRPFEAKKNYKYSSTLLKRKHSINYSSKLTRNILTLSLRARISFSQTRFTSLEPLHVENHEIWKYILSIKIEQ